MQVTVCRNCQSRASGELWHGPHCQCRKPDFVSVDTTWPILPQLKDPGLLNRLQLALQNPDLLDRLKREMRERN